MRSELAYDPVSGNSLLVCLGVPQRESNSCFSIFSVPFVLAFYRCSIKSRGFECLWPYNGSKPNAAQRLFIHVHSEQRYNRRTISHWEKKLHSAFSFAPFQSRWELQRFRGRCGKRAAKNRWRRNKFGYHFHRKLNRLPFFSLLRVAEHYYQMFYICFKFRANALPAGVINSFRGCLSKPTT